MMRLCNLPDNGLWSTAFLLAAGLLCVPPVIAQQIPPDDFQISRMVTPPDHPSHNFGSQASIVFNPDDNEYLVVWVGDIGLTAPYEQDIFGRRIAASTGQLLGSQFRISHMGPDGDANYSVGPPAVEYVPYNNRYLVVWSAEHDIGQVQGEFEIFGQFVNGGTDSLNGSRIRMSEQGPGPSASWDAFDPDVSYSTNGYLLVVWAGDSTVPSHYEIFARLVSNSGVLYNTIKVSDMAAAGDLAHDAAKPAVARADCDFSPICQSGWMVVWEGDDDVQTATGETEIFAQHVSDGMVLLESDDVRISHVGVDGDASRDASDPAIVFNWQDEEFLVVWAGDQAIDNKLEIQSARVQYSSPPGWEPLPQITVSDMSTGGSSDYVAMLPCLSYDNWRNGYLVSWAGLDDRPDQALYEFEIFSRRLSSTGSPLESSLRISTSGPSMNADYDAWRPAQAFDSNEDRRSHLVVWESMERFFDSGGGFFYDDYEIFGQNLQWWIFGDGFEDGNASSWSSTQP